MQDIFVDISNLRHMCENGINIMPTVMCLLANFWLLVKAIDRFLYCKLTKIWAPIFTHVLLYNLEEAAAVIEQ